MSAKKPKITSEEIQNLAQLARIDISDAEATSLSDDFGAILQYVSEISALSADVTLEVPVHRNVMRADDNPHESGIHSEALIEAFSAAEGGYLKVKKILS